MHSEADDTSGMAAGSAYDMVQPATFVRALEARRAQAGAASSLAVLAIRLDRFASACETLGPQRAARLRKQVEARIAGLLPAGAGIHWLALADLAVATALPDDITDPDRLGSRIGDDLARPFSLDGFELFLSSSIGVVLDHPDIATERSLQHAVDAMLRVCRQGGDGLASGSTSGAPPTAPLLAALPQALKRGELSLQLQPRADFKTANVSGYTVRLRWQHPTLGRVAPKDFLPAMESLGLMGAIASWLLQGILPMMKAADAIGPVQFTLLAASAQLHRTQMMEALNAAIDSAGIAPERLCIEVPVSAVPDDEALFAQFRLLRQRGVQLALSDFNDTEASLQTLHRVKPDIVTLDARHLGHADQPPDTPERLRAACALARNAGALVCAKGVETRQQLEAVRAWGCHSLQGYLLAQPFPATWLVQTHWAIQQRARQLLKPAA
jgi:EAL domain-containing protein (putative c-di-GMP-specific phosphodiesterase class I)/GGDEF domain-containing protein